MGEGGRKGDRKDGRDYTEKVRDPIIQPNGKDTLLSGRAVPLLRILPTTRAPYPFPPKKGPLKCVSFRGFVNCVKCQSVYAGKPRKPKSSGIIKSSIYSCPIANYTFSHRGNEILEKFLNEHTRFMRFVDLTCNIMLYLYTLNMRAR